eukprot:SAG31_NODE_34199_length_335_cov_1.093220_1_plen_75_part_01
MRSGQRRLAAAHQQVWSVLDAGAVPFGLCPTLVNRHKLHGTATFDEEDAGRCCCFLHIDLLSSDSTRRPITKLTP